MAERKVWLMNRKVTVVGGAGNVGATVARSIAEKGLADVVIIDIADQKAAGFEPVEVQSGYNGNSLGAYMELRDDQVTFFARTLARGKHSVAYRMHAETPGKFSALPATATGVDAPELKANSDELKLRIED